MKSTGVGYGRKSIRLSGLTNELENVIYQLNQIEEYAHQHDIDLIETYSDIGYSGVLISRPELNKMLDDLNKAEKKVNYLILYSNDRLARDLSTSIELMMEITKLVDFVVFVAEGVHSSIHSFREDFLKGAARAAEDRSTLKKRLRQGRRAKVVYGKQYRSTFKPLGYIQPNKKELKLATIDNTRDLDSINGLIIVQCIFLAHISRYSSHKIAEWINEEFGLTNRGKEWSNKAVLEILNNPIYAGMLTGVFINKDVIGPVNTIEPLIPLSLYKYFQLRKEGRKKGRGVKIQKNLPDLAICAECLVPIQLMKGNQYYCPECNEQIPIDIYIKQLRNEFTSLLQGNKFNPNVNVILNEKKQHIRLKHYSLNKKLDELVQIEKEIKQDYANKIDKQLSMMEANQEAQIKLKKEIELNKGYYNFLFQELNDINHGLENDFQLEELIRLPFLIVIDFRCKKIFIKFHNNIFGGDSNQSRTLKMVDEGIRLFEDIWGDQSG